VIQACGISDTGRVRTTNEDKFISDPEFRLFAVADGMGGHSAGEVASRLAIETVAGFIHRSANEVEFSWPYGLDKTLSFDGNRLRTAVHLANRKVFRTAESSDDYDGMGTTFVGMLVNDGRVSVAHVGDSRVYLLSSDHLAQLTFDDTWAATILAQDPTLDPAEIARHPMRNVLTNVIGARDHVDVHLTEAPVSPGDIMLLCSDGLHGVLDGDTIKGLLTRHTDVKAAARALIDAALDGGGRDNVTALVVRYEGAP
jgi:protein phosphatase